jgi:FkbM family methyltransferase
LEVSVYLDFMDYKKTKLVLYIKKIKNFLIKAFARLLIFFFNKKPKVYKSIYGLKFFCFPFSALDNHIINDGIVLDYICLTNDLSFDKNSVMFDVGANVGFISCILARKYDYVGQIHSFEPDSQNYAQFEQNLKLNNLKNIFIHKIALQDDHNKIETKFHIRRLIDNDFNENRGLSSLKNIKLGNVREDNVTSSTIDNEFIRLKLSRFVFLKIDVEGSEFNVLKGGEKSIKKYLPVILYEYSNTIDELTNTKNTVKAYNFLNKLGYLQYYIEEEKFLIPLNKPNRKISDVNVICFHKSKLPNFIK